MKKDKFRKRDALAVGASVAGLGISATNLATNLKKKEDDKKYQDAQLKAMEKLTRSLNKVDNSLKHLPDKETSPAEGNEKKFFKFFQKNNSHTLDHAMVGGAIGGGLAAGSMYLPSKIGGVEKITKRKTKEGKEIAEERKWEDDENFKYPGIRDKYNSLDPYLRNALFELGGIAIGATLGAIIGGIKDISEFINKKTTVNKRLMEGILVNLKKSGLKEGSDFTRDPKKANLLKTKVCLVISKSADTLKLLINTVSDNKLKKVTEEITKNLPTMSTVTEKVSDRYNELNITTMTSNNGDAVWVSSIAERFIKAGYPVYLVEVG